MLSKKKVLQVFTLLVGTFMGMSIYFLIYNTVAEQQLPYKPLLFVATVYTMMFVLCVYLLKNRKQ